MSDRKYAVVLTIWETSGESHRFCICDNYEDALIIKLALEKNIPERYRVERGDDEIYQRYEIKIVPLFRDEVK